MELIFIILFDCKDIKAIHKPYRHFYIESSTVIKQYQTVKQAAKCRKIKRDYNLRG